MNSYLEEVGKDILVLLERSIAVEHEMETLLNAWMTEAQDKEKASMLLRLSHTLHSNLKDIKTNIVDKHNY